MCSSTATRPDLPRGLELPLLGVDEERDAAAGLAQRRHGLGELRGRRRPRPARPRSSPPRAARAPGSGVRAGWRRAMATISSVAAISRLSGHRQLGAGARRRASWMWRRSSRRCAVMPSAPASAARRAARNGSGCGAPRAWRTVATWSMLTPRRIGRGVRLVKRSPPRRRGGGRGRPPAAIAAIRLSGRATPAAGDVEGGAVVGRGAHERQAEGDVHAAVEVEHLDRDQRLVVIHADGRVVARARASAWNMVSAG